MAHYPEHSKLTAVSEMSQAQGELLDWLSGQGVHLMVWREWDETTTEDCCSCVHGSDTGRARCQCSNCKGTHTYELTRHRKDWVADGRSLQALLAEFHGIDLAKLEAEKRAMLDSLRARETAVAS